MFQGQLIGIFVGASTAGPMQSLAEVEALAGRGLAGDRYSLGTGTFSRESMRPDEEVTLIESEALEAAAREHGVEVAPLDARRNLLTRDVPLNHLVGREFLVGPVRLRGIRLCEPCKHLEKLTGKSVCKALVHGGGLRAQVLLGGTLRVNDTVRPAEG